MKAGHVLSRRKYQWQSANRKKGRESSVWRRSLSSRTSIVRNSFILSPRCRSLRTHFRLPVTEPGDASYPGISRRTLPKDNSGGSSCSRKFLGCRGDRWRRGKERDNRCCSGSSACTGWPSRQLPVSTRRLYDRLATMVYWQSRNSPFSPSLRITHTNSHAGEYENIHIYSCYFYVQIQLQILV